MSNGDHGIKKTATNPPTMCDFKYLRRANTNSIFTQIFFCIFVLNKMVSYVQMQTYLLCAPCKRETKEMSKKVSQSKEKAKQCLLFCIFWAARHFSSFGGGEAEVGEADLNNPATKNINVSCGLISNKLWENKITKSLNTLHVCWSWCLKEIKMF